MKKIVLTVATFALFSLTVLAQRPMWHYHSTYYNRDYRVTIGVRDTSIRTFEVNKLDEWDEVWVMLARNKRQPFIDYLTYLKGKFIEWRGIAEANKLSQYEKKIEVASPYIRICWGRGPMWRDDDVVLKPVFRVDRFGLSYIEMADEAGSRGGHQRYSLVFVCEDDFDDLISALLRSVDESENIPSLEQKNQSDKSLNVNALDSLFY